MTSKFTNAGLALFAAWEADPTQKKPIKYMALGDLTIEQYANPDLYDGTETALHDEKVRVEVNRVYQAAEDATIARVEAIVNPTERGWHMREVGLFVEGETPDDDPVLVWIGHHPETYIPVDYEDMIVGEIVTVPIQFGTADAVELFTTNAALVNWDDFLGQAAEEGVRDLNQAHVTALLKNYIFGG